MIIIFHLTLQNLIMNEIIEIIVSIDYWIICEHLMFKPEFNNQLFQYY